MSIEHACTELEYYEDILQIYEDSLSSPNPTEIDDWLDARYIKIFHDLKCKKPILDAPIEEVAKNAILLILNLFKSKKNVDSSVSWQFLSKEDRNLLRYSLVKVLGN